MRLLLPYLVLLFACAPAPEPPTDQRSTADPSAQVWLVDATEAAGLRGVEHRNGSRGTFHMAELMGSGAALVDLDGDGDLDLWWVDGGALPDAGPAPDAAAADAPDDGPRDRLFRNDTSPGGPTRFVDVTDEATAHGFAPQGHGMGVAVGDIDGDGRPDLLRTAYGRAQLWRNLGGFRFEERALPPPVEPSVGEPWSVAATCFDRDADGDLDLFIGHYLAHDPSTAPRCANTAGRPDFCGASHFPGVADRLLDNDGTGRFTDVSEAVLGPAEQRAGRTLGVLAADLDGDGHVDLYVANDADPNHLWRHRGAVSGAFEDVALLAGVAVNGQGKAEASMGVDAADPDGDGDLDLFMTHLVIETHTAYRQRSPGVFEDSTAASGLGPPSRLHTGFGTTFFDANGDGHLDLHVANGAVQTIEALAQAGDPQPFHEVDQLFLGRGDGTFREASHGAVFEYSAVSRGVAAGDVDNDGDTDLLVTHNNGPVRLLLNTSDPELWLGLDIREGARSALGSTVTLVTNHRARIDRVARDGSYASSGDPRLVFALAEGETIEGVRVRWVGGDIEEFPAPPIGGYVKVERGQSWALGTLSR